jgi:hypothetical protein
MLHAVVLAHHRVDLVGAREAIMQIIPSAPDPANGELAQEHDHHGQRHADPDADQWNALLSPSLETRCWFPGGNVRRSGRLRRSWLRCLSARGSTDTRRLLPGGVSSDGAMPERAPGGQTLIG